MSVGNGNLRNYGSNTWSWETMTQQTYMKKTVTEFPPSLTRLLQPCLVRLADTVATYQDALLFFLGI